MSGLGLLGLRGLASRALRWSVRALGHQVRELLGNRPVYLIVMPIPGRHITVRFSPPIDGSRNRIRRHQIKETQHFLIAGLHITFQSVVVVVIPERSLCLRKPKLLAHG